MSRSIAFFDFDGTITFRDSLLEFIKFCKGKPAFYLGFLLLAPVLVAYKLNIISNQLAKELSLRYFFGSMSAEEFSARCERFSTQRLPALIRPKALTEIRKLQQAGAEVVVVSASPENWLKSWCDATGVRCIATRLQIDNNRITGKIRGFNCHGTEKVRRIQEQHDLSRFSAVYCYGDTPGDKPMLALGTVRFYRPFGSKIEMPLI